MKSRPPNFNSHSNEQNFGYDFSINSSHTDMTKSVFVFQPINYFTKTQSEIWCFHLQNPNFSFERRWWIQTHCKGIEQNRIFRTHYLQACNSFWNDVNSGDLTLCIYKTNKRNENGAIYCVDFGRLNRFVYQ